MKKYSVIVVLSMLLLSLGSCETVDFGDTNRNVNGPSDPNTAALLTAAQVRYVEIGFRDWLVNPHLYVQYQAQPIYQDESRYSEVPANWSAFYTQALNPLQTIVARATDPVVSTSVNFVANGSAANQLGVAKIMKVVVFKKITDTFGPIPYVEALNPENVAPAYTSQEAIYEDFIAELKAARDMLNPAEPGPTGDVIYQGDVMMWKKFANSLLLSISMQMSEAAPTLAASEFQAALGHSAGVIETVAEEAWYMPVNLASLLNPWTAFRPADYNMSEFFQNAFQGDQPNSYSNSMFDTRLNVFSSAPTAEGLPYGLANYTGISSLAAISSYITEPLAPFAWMTSSYVYLMRAEAGDQGLGWTGESSALMLETGIVQSYESVTFYYGNGPHTGSGLAPIDITGDAAAFAAARVADAATVGMLQVIREEKWAALFPQGFQAWCEWRRTDVPALTPSPDPLNDGPIATRYLYPTTELNVNDANYQAGVSLLNPPNDKNTSKVWWDQ